MKKTKVITQADKNYEAELEARLKRWLDEEVNTRVRGEVQLEVKRIFRELGR